MNVQVTLDQHMKAFEWLESHLEVPIYRFEAEDVMAMIEQVVSQ